MRKKIIFLVPLPPPIHGASIINQSILNSKRIKNNFFTCFINSSTTQEIKFINKFQIYKLFLFIKIFFNLIIKIKSFKPDLVYINLSPHGLGFYKDSLLLLIIKFFEIKVVSHMHGKGIKKQIKNSKYKKKLFKFLFRNVHLIILSKRLRKDVEQVRDKSTLIKIINNFAYYSNNSTFKSSKKKLTFIYLSLLHPSKGILTFLDAIEILQKKNKRYDYFIKIIGNFYDAVTKKKINKRILKLKNINLLGPKFGVKKFKELSSSDILVFPTIHTNEAFPIVILEAMSRKLAVITTDNGGIRDIITHKKNGLILKKPNAIQCSKAMLTYLNNKNLSKKHGSNNKKKYLKYFIFNRFEVNLVNSLKEIVSSN